jgi:hypothetical protein
MPTFPDPQLREDHVLLVSKGGGGTGCLVFGVLLGVGGAVAVAIGGESGAIFGSIALLIGVLVSIVGGMNMMMASRLGQVTITLSGHPLLLGEEWTAEFSQQVKSRCVVNSVSATLVCEEWVQYQRGTDTRTDKHKVLSNELMLHDFGDVGPAAPITGEFAFTIPENAMHSFDASDNRISWRLDFHTDVEGWMDRSTVIPLEVAPRYANPKEMS